MINFHEHKLWQDAYVALMEVHDTFGPLRGGDDRELVEDVISAATALTSKIADGLSRIDRRFGRQVLLDAVGMVAVVRTHLAVAWGRKLLDDATFKALDDRYAHLSENLQRSR